MKIKKTSIHDYKSYFGFLKPGEQFRLIATTNSTTDQIAIRIGFNLPISVGHKILPPPTFGPTTRFNALGKEIKRTDLPMETAYRTVKWHWKQWDGRYNTVPMSKFVDVPYQRYPREKVLPPSEELEILQTPTGELMFSSRVVQSKPENEKEVLHLANLMLEIFGEFDIVSNNLEGYFSPKEVRLNWEILPPGEYPWERVSDRLKTVINQLPKGNQPWATHRVDKIRSYKPTLHAIGFGGFQGYVVFGFGQRGFYLLECIKYGNATYVFGNNWETLSKLTKAQIIQGNLSIKRVIHTESWDSEITKLFA